MKLLIDTNVILDMVFGRNGCETSMELFRRTREIGAAAYVTASSVTDLFYIIRKETHDTEKHMLCWKTSLNWYQFLLCRKKILRARSKKNGKILRIAYSI